MWKADILEWLGFQDGQGWPWSHCHKRFNTQWGIVSLQWVTACTNSDIVLAGPGQLKCAEFEKAVQDYIFWAHTCGLGFDEVHLLNMWVGSFTKTFFRWALSKLVWMTLIALGFSHQLQYDRALHTTTYVTSLVSTWLGFMSFNDPTTVQRYSYYSEHSHLQLKVTCSQSWTGFLRAGAQHLYLAKLFHSAPESMHIFSTNLPPAIEIKIFNWYHLCNQLNQHILPRHQWLCHQEYCVPSGNVGWDNLWQWCHALAEQAGRRAHWGPNSAQWPNCGHAIK